MKFHVLPRHMPFTAPSKRVGNKQDVYDCFVIVFLAGPGVTYFWSDTRDREYIVGCYDASIGFEYMIDKMYVHIYAIYIVLPWDNSTNKRHTRSCCSSSYSYPVILDVRVVSPPRVLV
jgi:hypothetical protein